MPDAKKSASELRREAHRLSGERPGYTHGATAPDEHDVQACLTCAIETIADRLEEAERTSWKLTQWLAACQILGQGEEPNVDHEAESPVVAAVRRLKERVEKAERAVEETHAEMDRKVNLLLRDRIKAECDRDSFKALFEGTSRERDEALRIEPPYPYFWRTQIQREKTRWHRLTNTINRDLLSNLRGWKQKF